MSGTTPRKSRHRHQPSGGGGARAVAASDYESDAAHYMTGPDVPPFAPPYRTNTELNLSVLRRYLPSIRAVVSIAANAVVYTIHPTGGNWEKSGIEGTMFVCEQEPVIDFAGNALPRACVFVLNRRGLENLVIHLCNTSVCEVGEELISFYVEDTGDANPGAEGMDTPAGNGQDKRVIGLWIHADEENTRQTNATKILEFWNQCRLAATATENLPENHQEGEAEGGADTGRRLSITDLFGQSNGASRR